jgi:hypothetical protein
VLERHQFALVHLLLYICQNSPPQNVLILIILTPDMYVMYGHKYISVGVCRQRDGGVA